MESGHAVCPKQSGQTHKTLISENSILFMASIGFKSLNVSEKDAIPSAYSSQIFFQINLDVLHCRIDIAAVIPITGKTL